MRKKKTILFLNLRQTVPEARAALLAAKRLDLDVVLLADKRPPSDLQDYVRQVEIADTYHLEQSLDAVHRIQQTIPLDGVITWGDRDVELMAAIAEQWSLPGPTRGAAKKARNKYRMRMALQKCLPQWLPKFCRVVDEGSLEEAMRVVGFPAVLKPTGASGSKGIFNVYHEKEARRALQVLNSMAQPSQDKIFSHYGAEFIFEEFLDGNEFSVEGWVSEKAVAVVGVTDKKTTEDYHIEYQHIFPSQQEESRQKTIVRNTEAIVSELGLNDCAFHLEAKWTSQGFRLVEVAARIGGGYITSHLIPMATPLNFYEEVLRLVTGEKPVSSHACVQYAGVRFLLALREGVLKNIRGLSNALTHPQVAHIFQEQACGKKLVLPPQHFSLLRTAAILAQGATYQSVADTLESLGNVCRVETREREEVGNDSQKA